MINKPEKLEFNCYDYEAANKVLQKITATAHLFIDGAKYTNIKKVSISKEFTLIIRNKSMNALDISLDSTKVWAISTWLLPDNSREIFSIEQGREF